MVATAPSVTVSCDVPILLSADAEMVALPGATALTTPSADTVATAGLLETHTTARPPMVSPSSSSTRLVYVNVSPTCMVRLPGMTATTATGFVAGPLLVSLHAAAANAAASARNRVVLRKLIYPALGNPSRYGWNSREARPALNCVRWGNSGRADFD